jgi:hypothetical protein
MVARFGNKRHFGCTVREWPLFARSGRVESTDSVQQPRCLKMVIRAGSSFQEGEIESRRLT